MTPAKGLCECGCGQATRVAEYNDASHGYVRGEPLRFVRGHNRLTGKRITYEVQDWGFETPCWVWQGERTKEGYGRVTLPGRVRKMAHRWYYEAEHGPIPEGLHLDHLCRIAACCRPSHLEPVTPSVNKQRSWDARKAMGSSGTILSDRSVAGEGA